MAHIIDDVIVLYPFRDIDHVLIHYTHRTEHIHIQINTHTRANMYTLTHIIANIQSIKLGSAKMSYTKVTCEGFTLTPT